jgi:hypothetical protein
MHTLATERDEKGNHYVHHSYDAYRTSHSHVVEYRGQTGLSLPAGYHKQSVGLGVFQSNLKSRHRAYTLDHYFTQRSSKAITQSKILRYERETLRQTQEINNA